MNKGTAYLIAAGFLFIALAAAVWPRSSLADAPPTLTISPADGRNSGIRYAAASQSSAAKEEVSAEAIHSPIFTPSPSSLSESPVVSARQQIATSTRSGFHPSSESRVSYSARVGESGRIPVADLLAAPPSLIMESGEDEVPRPPPVIFPAALIDIDSPSVSSPQAAERLTEIANSFADALNQSKLEHSSPEYRQLWSREQTIADAQFRAMYGGHAWMAHHIESHHASSSSPAH